MSAPTGNLEARGAASLSQAKGFPMRQRKKAIWLGALAAGVLAAGFGTRALQGQDPQPGKRSQFMRLKLEYSKRVLEGLALEDYGLIGDNARRLKRLSEAAEWEDPMIPNVHEYLPYTTEFQRLTDELSKSAKEKNIDGATLAYVQLTMSCVKCHKYVRFATK